MSLPRNLFSGIAVSFTVAAMLRNLDTQRSFLRDQIKPILAEAENTNDGSLDTNDFKKINEYYGLAVPAVLGEAFCALHNKKMSEAERIASTAQGAMTGLFDDFFDKQYLSDAAIEALLHNNTEPSKSSNEKLFTLFYKKALQHVPDKNNMVVSLVNVYKAQLESKKQEGQKIPVKEIETITYCKGGASLVFYRSAFSPEASEAEEKLIYDLGSMMQLCNDIFDVYKDRENKISTLITEADNIKNIKVLLRQSLSNYFKDAYTIGFEKENVKRFLSILSLGIFSRASVCLDQLESNQATSNGIFSVHTYSRKQLICDMDTWKNKLQSASYHIELMRSPK